MKIRLRETPAPAAEREHETPNTELPQRRWRRVNPAAAPCPAAVTVCSAATPSSARGIQTCPTGERRYHHPPQVPGFSPPLSPRGCCGKGRAPCFGSWTTMSPRHHSNASKLDARLPSNTPASLMVALQTSCLVQEASVQLKSQCRNRLPGPEVSSVSVLGA